MIYSTVIFLLTFFYMALSQRQFCKRKPKIYLHPRQLVSVEKIWYRLITSACLESDVDSANLTNHNRDKFVEFLWNRYFPKTNNVLYLPTPHACLTYYEKFNNKDSMWNMINGSDNPLAFIISRTPRETDGASAWRPQHR